MGRFHQFLHQRLGRPLRDFQTESSELPGAQEWELTQALQRMTGRFKDILAESSESVSSNGILKAADRTSSLPIAVSLDPNRLHLVTSCEGVILMAHEGVGKTLGIDQAALDNVSLGEWVPQEEWRLIRNRLRVLEPPYQSLNWVMSVLPSEGCPQKVQCSATPLFDPSRQMTVWHWTLHLGKEDSPTHSLTQLVQSLEAKISDGHSLAFCLTRICEGLVKTFGFPFVWIATLHDGQEARLQAHAGMPNLDWESHGLSWWTALSRESMLAKICAVDETYSGSTTLSQSSVLPLFPPAFQLQETLCLPLVRGDTVCGLVVVCSKTPQVFDVTVTAWLRELCPQIQQLLERGMELERLRLHSSALASLKDAVCVTDVSGRLEWVNDAYASLVDVPADQIVGSMLSSFPHAKLQALGLHHDCSTKDVSCVKTEIIGKRQNGDPLTFEQVLTPLFNENGQITHFVGVLSDVTEQKASEVQMKHRVYHDDLTDLPNRVMFEDRMQQAVAHARRNGTLMALLFLDLDNFKPINDRHGHHIGDRLLRIVAKRLVSCVRSTDTVARLSGDEFTVILQGLDHIPDIRQVAQKILDCLTSPIRLGGREILVQTSIGISVYPKDSIESRRLVEIADQAMYRAKEFGGHGWYFATSEWNVDRSA